MAPSPSHGFQEQQERWACSPVGRWHPVWVLLFSEHPQPSLAVTWQTRRPVTGQARGRVLPRGVQSLIIHSITAPQASHPATRAETSWEPWRGSILKIKIIVISCSKSYCKFRKILFFNYKVHHMFKNRYTT